MLLLTFGTRFFVSKNYKKIIHQRLKVKQQRELETDTILENRIFTVLLASIFQQQKVIHKFNKNQF